MAMGAQIELGSNDLLEIETIRHPTAIGRDATAVLVHDKQVAIGP
jgi:hypothetical protein